MMMTIAFCMDGTASLMIANKDNFVCLHGVPAGSKKPPYPDFELGREQMENLRDWLSRELESDI